MSDAVDLFAEPDLAASPRRTLKLFRANGYKAHQWLRHGPSGFKFVLEHQARLAQGSVIVSQAPLDDGTEWLHASLAWVDQMPSYFDLQTLHAAVFSAKRWSYQVFAPASEHVNIHSYALHLWGRADGKPALPTFGEAGSI
jgi:hypothetical protein